MPADRLAAAAGRFGGRGGASRCGLKRDDMAGAADSGDLSTLSTLSTGKRAQIPFVRIGRGGHSGASRSGVTNRQREETPDAVSAETVEILREGDNTSVGGAAGKKREAAGKPKAEPTFPESGRTRAFGQGKCERPPGELARRETGRDLKGLPGEERTVGKPGSPGGKDAAGTIAGLPEGCPGKVASLLDGRPQDGRRLAGKTSDRRKRSLLRESLKGSPGACFDDPGSGPSGACFSRIRLGTDRGPKTPAANP